VVDDVLCDDFGVGQLVEVGQGQGLILESWTSQPAAWSWASMVSRARCSGFWLGLAMGRDVGGACHVPCRFLKCAVEDRELGEMGKGGIIQ
jgi:hypothetical protein